MHGFHISFKIQSLMVDIQENHSVFFTYSSFIGTYHGGRIRTAFLHIPALLSHLPFLEPHKEQGLCLCGRPHLQVH